MGLLRVVLWCGVCERAQLLLFWHELLVIYNGGTMSGSDVLVFRQKRSAVGLLDHDASTGHIRCICLTPTPTYGRAKAACVGSGVSMSDGEFWPLLFPPDVVLQQATFLIGVIQGAEV